MELIVVLHSFATGQMCSSVKQPMEMLPFNSIILMSLGFGK